MKNLWCCWFVVLGIACMPQEGSTSSYHPFFTGPSSPYERMALAAGVGTPTLRPYFDEWNYTMYPWGFPGPPSIHFYMECRDKEVQIYFAVEEVDASMHSLSSHSSLWHLEPKWITLQHRIHLLINSKMTSFGPTLANDTHRPWHVPMERSFQTVPVDISNIKHRNASLLVQINEFCQYVSFPLSRCIDPITPPSTTALRSMNNSHPNQHHRSKSQRTNKPRIDKHLKHPVQDTINTVNTNPSLTESSASTGGNIHTNRNPPPPHLLLPYVRHVDDGLMHATIQPSAQEWSTAMRPAERRDIGRLRLKIVHVPLEIPAPFHFYFRCVDGILRIYFTCEERKERPQESQPEGSELRIPLDVFRNRFSLYVEGHRVPIRSWHGGADAQFNLTSLLNQGSDKDKNSDQNSTLQSVKIQLGYQIEFVNKVLMFQQYITYPLFIITGDVSKSTCSQTDPSLWIEKERLPYTKKAATTAAPSLTSSHHNNNVGNASSGSGHSSGNSSIVVGKKGKDTSAADHHYNSTMSILSRVFHNNSNSNNNHHNRHYQTYRKIRDHYSATTTTTKPSSGWNFPSFHMFAPLYIFFTTEFKIERPATLLVCLQLLGAMCLYGYAWCRCQLTRWTNACCGCGWGGCCCRKGPIIKDRNKNHPSYRPSTTSFSLLSPSDKDRQYIRKGATAIIIVSILGLVVLTCLEPSTPLLSFPLGPPPRSNIYADNDIVVHVHSFDQWVHRPAPQNPLLIEGLVKHMIYHRCALNVTRYEVVIQDDHLHQYLSHPYLYRFAQEGWLTFLLKGHTPTRLNMVNCNWQGVYENMAILRYWRTKTHLMFWNVDEYLVYSPMYTPETFRALVVFNAVVGFQRYASFCTDTTQCSDDRPEIHNFSLIQRKISIGAKLNDKKLLVNPDFVGCFIMHWAGCGTGLVTGKNQHLHYQDPDTDVFVLPETSAIIVHLENLFEIRWKRSHQDQKWMFEQLDKKNETIHVKYNPVVTQCNPTLI